MNYFLYINRKLVFLVGVLITIFFLLIIFYKHYGNKNLEIKNTNNNLTQADISRPKFAINNDSKKIYITAEEGNFLNKNEVLLKDNVRFKSNDFSIETEIVIFNREKQTAQSKTKSVFKSDNTTISSDGFNIYDKGNKITFYGNSYIVLK